MYTQLMKHYIKIWTILFIFSATPIIVSNLLQSLQIEDQSNVLIAKKASPILNSTKIEKQLPSTNLDRYKKAKKLLYLTFDDGPNSHTIEILKALKSKNVQATFFLLKANIDKHPEILKQIIAAGNSVGCHGVSHRIDIFYSNVNTAITEMKTCQRAIYDVTRVNTQLIRVPFGSYPHLTHEIKDGLNNAGFIYWDWNIDSEDWTVEDEHKVFGNIIKQLQLIEARGKTPTILLHDKKVTAKMLPKLLDELLARDYEMKALSSGIKPVQFDRFQTPVQK
nr:polysaccharide deacetylase family protein [Calidifontibacillus oryziterrae]